MNHRTMSGTTEFCSDLKCPKAAYPHMVHVVAVKAPEPDGMALLIKWEMDGLETYDEAVLLAKYLVDTGLVNSTGNYQRFVRSILDSE